MPNPLFMGNEYSREPHALYSPRSVPFLGGLSKATAEIMAERSQDMPAVYCVDFASNCVSAGSAITGYFVTVCKRWEN
jgi:hypothetical protein